MKWKTMIAALVMLGLLAGCAPPPAPNPPAEVAHPLPSWNDGEAKQRILDFVARVTDPASPDFVPEPERIATFDNDGTLWAEQPIYFQLIFALDRLRAMAADHPQWN